MSDPINMYDDQLNEAYDEIATLRARVEELEALKERVVLWAQDAYIDPDSGPDECRGAGCYLTDETCRELVAILAGGGKEGEDERG